MLFRSLIAACAAIVLFAVAVQTAEAYPITARVGTTTVTGIYRPLDLNLTLQDGTDALYYNSVNGDFRFSAIYSGTYTGVGYIASGSAGNWQLVFGNYSVPTFPSYANDVANNNTTDTITLSATAASGAVGRLTYLGGGGYGSVPVNDTPVLNDYFEFYQTLGGAFLKVTCNDLIADCNDFDVDLLPGLQMLGPYAQSFGYELALSRVNSACEIKDSAGAVVDYTTCGGIQMSASSIPEPASLALVGLALSGLALVRRRQHKS